MRVEFRMILEDRRAREASNPNPIAIDLQLFEWRNGESKFVFGVWRADVLRFCFHGAGKFDWGWSSGRVMRFGLEVNGPFSFWAFKYTRISKMSELLISTYLHQRHNQNQNLLNLEFRS